MGEHNAADECFAKIAGVPNTRAARSRWRSHARQCQRRSNFHPPPTGNAPYEGTKASGCRWAAAAVLITLMDARPRVRVPQHRI